MKQNHINFVGQQKLAFWISLILIIASIASVSIQGLALGLDFTGGTLVEVGFDSPTELTDIRKALANDGYEDAVVQHYGSTRDVLIRVEADSAIPNNQLGNRVFESLQKAQLEGSLRRVEFVGPKVGEELTEQGAMAMLVALLGILIYVGFRFEYRFAVGAVVALIHDVVITIGFFSITHIPFDLTVLAAILAVIGYSLNDTIVVYDRIRENFLRLRKGSSSEIVNVSLNQTLSRTLVTSLTTLFVVVALYFLGGELINGFATALILGILVGTYSSIFVASTILIKMGVSKEDMMPPKKEGEELSENPFENII